MRVGPALRDGPIERRHGVPPPRPTVIHFTRLQMLKWLFAALPPVVLAAKIRCSVFPVSVSTFFGRTARLLGSATKRSTHMACSDEILTVR